MVNTKELITFKYNKNKTIMEKELLFEMTTDVQPIGNVKFDITYSGGEDPTQLDFESITVSEDNNLSEEQVEFVEDRLSSGLELDLIEEIEAYYKNSNITISF